MRVAVGVKGLDDLLGGGVEPGALTELFGEAGTGKTNVCLQLARNVARAGRKAVYIDTEGVSLERLGQMCGADFQEVQRRVLFFEPYSLGEQEKIIHKAVRLVEGSAEVGIVCLDSATLFYRVALGNGDDQRERRVLTRQLHDLHAVARRREVPVVLTNQVYTNLENDALEPLGGQLLRHLSKASIRLERGTAPGLRRAVVAKHRAVAEGQFALFRIGSHGLEDP